MTVRNHSKISMVSIILSENQLMRVGTIKDEEKLYLVLGAVCDNILLD
jgi:hypothetical protein